MLPAQFTRVHLITSIVFSLLLAACGGGSSSPPISSSSSSSAISSSSATSSSSISSSSSSSSVSSSSSSATTSSSSSSSSSSSPSTHSISGFVSGDGQSSVVLHLDGPVTASTTASIGSYAFSNLSNGTYTVTPSSRVATYNPTSIIVTLSGANVTNLDFNSYYGSGSTTGLGSIWFADSTHGWGVFTNSMVQTWNGTGWTQVNPSLIPSTGSQLMSVSGSGINDVWAVGLDGKILHWNGSTWSLVVSPVGTEDLFTVWSRTANDAWIGGGTSILHWNGTSWSVTLSNRSGGSGSPNAFWGASANDVWCVTPNGTFHWDGSIWDFVSPKSEILQSLWGFSANDIWAVGWNGLIQHWNGSTWTTITNPATTLLSGVWGSAPNDIWVGGYSGTLLHWNGTTWTTLDTGTDFNVYSLFGSGATNVWIAGPKLLLKVQ